MPETSARALVVVTPSPFGRMFTLPAAHGDFIASALRAQGKFPVMHTRDGALFVLDAALDACGPDDIVDAARAEVAADEEAGMVDLIYNDHPSLQRQLEDRSAEYARTGRPLPEDVRGATA